MSSLFSKEDILYSTINKKKYNVAKAINVYFFWIINVCAISIKVINDKIKREALLINRNIYNISIKYYLIWFYYFYISKYNTPILFVS